MFNNKTIPWHGISRLHDFGSRKPLKDSNQNVTEEKNTYKTEDVKRSFWRRQTCNPHEKHVTSYRIMKRLKDLRDVFFSHPKNC